MALPRPSRVRAVLAPVLVLVLAVCGGGEGGGGGPTGGGSVLTTVALSAAAPSIQAGTTTQLTAVARDQNGAPMAGAALAFETSAPGVLTVAPSGLATSPGPVGAATITARATVGGTTIVSSPTAITVVPAAPAAITATGGAAQIGRRVGALADVLAARVDDRFGNPVPGIAVGWNATAGAPVLGAATTTTDAAGVAQNTLTLGGAVGTTVVAASTSGVASLASFTIASIAGAPATVVLVDPLLAAPAAGSSALVRVRAADAFGNPTPGIVVTFAASGGGRVAPGSATTDAAGIAAATWTTGTAVGANGLTAAAAGATGAPLALSLATTAGAPATLEKLGADPAGLVAGEGGGPLVVRVRDANGNAIVGAAVAFAVAGPVSPNPAQVGAASVVTDAAGLAVVGFTTATTVGLNTVTATVPAAPGVPAVTYTTTTIAGAATGAQSSLTATLPAGALVADGVAAVAVAVRLRDANGNATANGAPALEIAAGAGAAVTAAVHQGGGLWSASLTSTRTGAVRLLARVGAEAVGGSPLDVGFVFGAAASIAIVAGDGQSATAGSAVAVAPTVIVRDAQGNAVAGTPVVFAPATGGGAVVPAIGIVTGPDGTAALTSWTLGTAVGVNTLLASVAGVGTAATFTATGVPGAAASIQKIGADPTDIVAGQSAGTLAVRVRDAHGNAVPDVTIAFAAAGPASATAAQAAPSSATTDAAGLASAALTTATTVGVNTLTATVVGAPGIAAAVFGTTTVAGAATAARSTAELSLPLPSPLVADGAAAAVVVAQLRDAHGNASTSGVPAFAVSPDAGRTLSAPVHEGNGRYTISIRSTVAGPVSISVTLAGQHVAGSALGLTFTAAGPVALQFVQQPGGVVAGTAMAPAVTVRLVDADGGTVASATDSVTLSIGTNPGGGALSGTTRVAAVGGIATFDGVGIDRVGEGYTLTASAGSLPGATSGAFTVTAAPAATLEFSQPPAASVAAGGAIAVTVTARDAFGNVATGFTGPVAIAIGANPSAATLTGTTSAAAVAGVATFANLAIDTVGAGYTLAASAGGTSGATSASFAVTPAAASALAFTRQPTSAAAGASITPSPIVRVVDAFGNTVVGMTGDVTVAIATNAGGGTLAGTRTVSAVAGAATFAGLSLDRVGTGYTLAASSGTLTGATSQAFDVGAAPASALAITQQPSASVAAGAGIALTVEARDAFGNVATGFTGGVSIALGANPSAATLSGTTTVAAVAGVATFAGLAIDTVGAGFTLAVSAGGTTGATSDAFAVVPAAASALAFTQPPTSTVAGTSIAPAPSVRIVDAFGNTVTGATDVVTVALDANPAAGVLGGASSVAAVGGTATFADLAITRSGSGYSLAATAGGLTGATSAAFDVAPAAPATLAFTAQPPGTTAAGVAIAATVAARDAFGNVATGFTGDVTLAIGTNPGGGTLAGVVTRAAAAGVATFDAAGAPHLDRPGVGYTLAASAAGVAGASSAAFDVVPGAASAVAFVQQPTSATAGVAISPAVVVRVVDAFGNTVGTSSATVTIGVGANPGGGTLSGTAGANAVNGIATFTTLSLDKAGAGYTLAASSAGLTGETSTPFAIAPAAAVGGDFTVQPSSTVAGNVITPFVEVTARDAFGNVATSFNGSVTIAIGTNPGGSSLAGLLTVSAVEGVATFNAIRLNRPGVGYTLTASAGGPPLATSAPFDVVSGEPAALVFVVQPSTVAANGAITPSVVVRLVDATGNRTTSTASVTIAIGTNAGGGTLSGTLTVSAFNGQASFAGLSINAAGTGYTLAATSAGLPTATSATFTVTP